MRGENLRENSARNPTRDGALFAADAVTTRTFDTPEFRGITFHEIRARSVVNRVPGASRMPFEWTINPYRGCTHACVYFTACPIEPGRADAQHSERGQGLERHDEVIPDPGGARPVCRPEQGGEDGLRRAAA
jgi:hypothetical protein